MSVDYFCQAKKPPPSWDELQDIEDLRRKILQRVELPFWRILGFWSGTSLRALALDWMIWIPFATFIAIRLQARVANANDPPGISERIDDTNLDILGGFLSFVLVLFVNQTNNRFWDMYLRAKRAAGQIQDAAGLASTQLPHAASHRLVRYLNAAHVAGYVGLGGPYTKRHFFNHFNEKHNLLNAKEISQLEEFNMDSGAGAFKRLITMCQREIGLARKAGHIDTYEAAQLHNHVLNLRGSMDGIYDYCDQPTHFFYIHLLCLLSALYLPLFAVNNAYSAGWGEDSDWRMELLNGVIVFLQSIFVVGLRLLGQMMVDPFGDDFEDLSVITYVSTTIENSRIILETTEEAAADEVEEDQMFEKGFDEFGNPVV